MTTPRIASSTPANVTVEPSHGRATAQPADRQFRSVLRDGAGALLGGVESATSVLPGGGLVSATVRGVASAASGGSADEASVAGEGGASSALASTLGNQSDTQMQYLELQQRMQDENRRFTTLSNVLKARHETAKTAIGNIR